MKKYTMIFLIAIFMSLISINKVNALDSTYTDYTYNGYRIPNIESMPLYNDYQYHVLLFNNGNNHFYLALSTDIFYYPDIYVKDKYPKTDSILTRNISTKSSGFIYYYFEPGVGWLLEGDSDVHPLKTLGLQYWIDMVYVDHYFFGKCILNGEDYCTEFNYKHLEPGYFNVENYQPSEPQFNIYENKDYIDENGQKWNRYDFNVLNYSDDYTYQFRLMNFDGKSYLMDWSSVPFVDDHHFIYDAPCNIRINLRILDKNNKVVFDKVYVVFAFDVEGYSIYNWQQDKFYMYVSGIYDNPIDAILYNNKTAIPEYYDFTTGESIEFKPNKPVTTSCTKDGLEFKHCLIFAPKLDIDDYNEDHEYGIRFKNVVFCQGHAWDPQCAAQNIDSNFYVVTSGHVSFGGNVDEITGNIEEEDVEWKDKNGNINISESNDNIYNEETGEFKLNKFIQLLSAPFEFIRELLSYVYLKCNVYIKGLLLFTFSIFFTYAVYKLLRK